MRNNAHHIFVTKVSLVKIIIINTVYVTIWKCGACWCGFYCEYFILFFLFLVFCSLLVAALEKLNINVKTIWILFYCRTSFGQHYYFHLYVRYWWKKDGFTAQFVGNSLKYIYSLSVVLTKLFRWLCWNAKVHKITIFMTRHIVWLFHETFESILKLLRFELGI